VALEPPLPIPLIFLLSLAMVCPLVLTNLATLGGTLVGITKMAVLLLAPETSHLRMSQGTSFKGINGVNRIELTSRISPTRAVANLSLNQAQVDHRPP